MKEQVKNLVEEFTSKWEVYPEEITITAKSGVNSKVKRERTLHITGSDIKEFLQQENRDFDPTALTQVKLNQHYQSKKISSLEKRLEYGLAFGVKGHIKM